MNLLAIIVLLCVSIIFAYQSKITIMYLFSSMVSFGASAYMFNYSATGAEAHEVFAFSMFAIIFVLLGLWQLILFGSNYVK